MKRIDEFYESYGACQGDAASFLTTALQQALVQDQGNAGLVICIYNELGSYYRGSSQYSQSVQAFQKAQQLVAQCMGTANVQYATLSNNLAGTYRLMGKYQQAIVLFEQALSCYRQQGATQTTMYASALNNLALVYQSQEKWPQTLDCLQQAVACLEKQEHCLQEWAITWSNLGAYYNAVESLEQGRAYYQRAMDVYKAHPQLGCHYGAVLNGMASICHKQGDCQGALGLYRQAAEVTQVYFGKNEEYVMALQNMAWMYEDLHQIKKAVETLQEALSTCGHRLGATYPRTKAIEGALQRLEQGGIL